MEVKIIFSIFRNKQIKVAHLLFIIPSMSFPIRVTSGNEKYHGKTIISISAQVPKLGQLISATAAIQGTVIIWEVKQTKKIKEKQEARKESLYMLSTSLLLNNGY